MATKYIWEFGSLIFIILGTVHLVYTFFTNKFSSKNEKAITEMKSSNPILTNETTLWKAWIGFNASHSIGAIFFGVINIYILRNFNVTLEDYPFFYILNISIVGFYLWLANKYWFRIPFWGILLTLFCYFFVIIMTLLN